MGSEIAEADTLKPGQKQPKHQSEIKPVLIHYWQQIYTQPLQCIPLLKLSKKHSGEKKNIEFHPK